MRKISRKDFPVRVNLEKMFRAMLISVLILDDVLLAGEAANQEELEVVMLVTVIISAIRDYVA